MAARVLCAVPDRLRSLRAARLVAAAEAADVYTRATGRAHPTWGTGSLMAAAASMYRIPEPDFDDDAYCECWIIVLQALIGHRRRRQARQPEAQDTQSGKVGSSSSRFSGISSPQSRHSP